MSGDGTGVPVEDGTLTESNSYVTTIEISAFCTGLGLAEWALASVTDQASAGLRGMAYVESKMYKGQKASNIQVRKWPRANATDEDNVKISTTTVPTAIKNAQCRASYEEVVSAGVLQPNLTRDSFTTKEKVDVIEINYEQGNNSTVFQAIDGYLIGYLVKGGKLIRC